VPVKKKKAAPAPASCEECTHWAGVQNKLRVGEVLAQVITKMEERLTSEDVKPSVADYLKLLQMAKEFGDDTPKEITVTWVEPEKPNNET
jgi:urease gamma subunit